MPSPFHAWGPLLATLAVLSIAGPARGSRTDQSTDAFAFFRPTVTLARNDLQRLDRGETIVRTLPHESDEVVVFAAVRTTADGARLAAWVRDIADLKRSAYVTAIARFSDSPRLEDLEALRLDDDDLEAARSCRPGDCGLRLSALEIALLQGAARTESRSSMDDAFQRIVLDRLMAYMAAGDAGLPWLADHGSPVSVRSGIVALEGRSTFLAAHDPRLASYIAEYPHASPAGFESFAYWSREKIGGHPSVNVTHVTMAESRDADQPETLVVGKQILSSHYVSAAIAFTAILRGRTPDEHFLVYLNRSQVDVLGRWYGGLARAVIERRIRSDAAGVFSGLKTRLESGDPPR